jgi:hypothetical protein
MSRIFNKKQRKKFKKAVHHPAVQTLGGLALSVGLVGLYRSWFDAEKMQGNREINPGVA